MASSSVVIHNLHVRRLARLELEDDPELIVHPDAVEAGQAPFQPLARYLEKDGRTESANDGCRGPNLTPSLTPNPAFTLPPRRRTG